MNNIDVDGAISYVNKIIDNVRCATCDRLQGSRLRYPCGHIACDDCIIYTEECQICTTSPQVSNFKSKLDCPLTLAVKNATNLLTASRSLFNVSAFQQKRKSEQLRIEKELFPQCIQAPMKYENKRKSTDLSYINKENKYTNYFPGEAISTPEENKMEDSLNYVQQWFNKNEKHLARKPFSDLSVNTQLAIGSRNKLSKQNVGDENVPMVGNRKRSHFKTTGTDNSQVRGSRKSINIYKSTPKKIKKEHFIKDLESSSIVTKKCENDESGVFMDNDPIVIDDSQESVIDKDKNAWLAVLKAGENEDSLPTSLDNTNQVANNSNQMNNSDALQIKDNDGPSVPFFKRSAIVETCGYCKNEVNSTKSVPVTNQTKPVRITIDNDNFLTTITVFNNIKNEHGMDTTNNASVQTDTCRRKTENYDICLNNDKITDLNESGRIFGKDINKAESECSSKESIDLFADDRKIFGEICQKPEHSKCIIEESDSDTELDMSGPISVKADVHRSCQDIEFGILNEVVNVQEHESKPRRGPRGLTPTSTDSSEKENYNPNRIKSHATGKKKSTKK